MRELPKELLKNAHFVRYFKIWNRNRDSILFVPLAEICRSSGFPEEARLICENGLRRLPQPVSGRLTLAKIYWDLNRKEEIPPILEGILREVPEHPEARELLEKLRPKKEEPPKPLVMETCSMAQILADQGEREMAAQILERILASNPGDARALKLKETICQKGF